jgi:hypothetical protein
MIMMMMMMIIIIIIIMWIYLWYSSLEQISRNRRLLLIYKIKRIVKVCVVHP